MRYVYRHYIVFGNASANVAVLGAVDRGFWRFHDVFDEHWEEANDGEFYTLWFGQFARENFDIEADELYSCGEKDTGENNALDFVRRSPESAEAFGVSATPTVFVDDVPVGWQMPELFLLVDERSAE